MGDFAANVAAAMDQLHPTWEAQRGVLAVSGGADSVALLRAIHESDPPGGLVVAHLNHQLRGDESDADAAFVRQLADRLCKNFHVETFSVKQLGGNLEGAARAVRYEWLARVAAETGAGWIATGHTADDQAETVLHRLIRGTGLTGLRGIAGARVLEGMGGALLPPPVVEGRSPRSGGRGDSSPPEQSKTHLPVASQPTSPQRGEVVPTPTVAGCLATTSPPPTPLPPPQGGGKPAILRPLLSVTRAELLAYLDDLGQPYRIDSTNSDLQFTRNRIRAEVLPLLRSFNPGIVDVLGRLAAQAEETAGWIDEETRKLMSDVELPRAADLLVLDGEKLSAAGEVRTRAALRFLWARERWPVNAMTFAHWRRAAAVALGEHPAADFPDGVHLRRAGRVVQLRRRS